MELIAIWAMMLAAQTAPAPAAAVPVDASAPTAIVPVPAPLPLSFRQPVAHGPQTWVTDDDYPAEALRGHMHGSVGFVLYIGINGAVNGCGITASSGYPLLDATTCRVIASRASFAPALDAERKPVASFYAGRMTWVMPEGDPDPLVSWRSTLRFTVGDDGSRTGCSVTNTGPVPRKAASVCDAIASGTAWDIDKLMLPFDGRAGAFTIDTGIKVAGAGDGIDSVDMSETDLLSLDQYDFRVNAQGYLEDCHERHRLEKLAPSTMGFCFPPYGPFGPDSRNGKRRATLTIVVRGPLSSDGSKASGSR